MGVGYHIWSLLIFYLDGEQKKAGHTNRDYAVVVPGKPDIIVKDFGEDYHGINM